MKNVNFISQAASKHIVIIGNTNVGKSSLLNAICEQDLALVSEIAGTTTDPVRRSYELLPYGPVVWIDTPGLSDDSLLGTERMSRSIKEIEKADFVIYILEASITKTIESEEISNIKAPLLQVFTKIDLFPPAELTSLFEQFPKAEFVSVKDANSIQRLRERIATELLALESVEPLILCDKLAPGAHILLVVPLDSEAPKGRMINPQNALLQEALKNGVVSSICTPKELHILTKSSIQWDWIITDSQAFKEVNQILTDSYINRKRPRLTSFSILMSRQKGNLQHLVEGAKQIENLAENDWVLIAEACSHSHSHEDIARIKIPFLLKEKCQKNLQFDYVNGKDFPEQMDKYALVIHCGGCMITRTTMQNRSAKVGHTPITNFGVVLAYLAGILPLAIQDLD